MCQLIYVTRSFVLVIMWSDSIHDHFSHCVNNVVIFSDAIGKQKGDTLVGYFVFCAQYSMEGVVWKGLYFFF